jgi:ribosomal protein L44E
VPQSPHPGPGAGQNHHRQRQIVQPNVRQQLQAAAVGQRQVGQHQIKGRCGLLRQAFHRRRQAGHHFKLRLRCQSCQCTARQIGILRSVFNVKHFHGHIPNHHGSLFNTPQYSSM